MRHVLQKTLLLGALAGAVGCGGSGAETPAPKTADSENTPERHANGPSMSTSAEIGALDEDQVTAAFQGAQKGLQGCLTAGAARNELEGGDIGFSIKVDGTGHLADAHAERSTLGDRETEKCMLDVLRDRTWPEPEGGTFGLAHNSFGFDMPNDARPPTAWDPTRVESTLGEISGKLRSCKHGAHGDFTATVYVGPDGAATSVGLAVSDAAGEDATDCLVSVLKDAKYPSPGSWPAKVTFPL